MMRRFQLIRHKDISGVSGLGTVAEGVEFTDGHVAMRWMSDIASTVIYTSIVEVAIIHGHGGNTDIAWLDEVSDQGGDEG